MSNIAHGPLVLEDVSYIVMCFEYIYGQACKLYDVYVRLFLISHPCTCFL